MIKFENIGYCIVKYKGTGPFSSYTGFRLFLKHKDRYRWACEGSYKDCKVYLNLHRDHMFWEYESYWTTITQKSMLELAKRLKYTPIVNYKKLHDIA